MSSPKHNHGQEDPLDRLKRLRPDEFDPEALALLFHELQVHQEELAAQNRQLIETQHALEESRDRFVDLFDFAPIGFMTLKVSGIIREINLTGASLLRKERSRILGLPFNAFVAVDDKGRFAEHLRKARQHDAVGSTVELKLNVGDASFVQLVTRQHATENRDEPDLLSALLDISERRRLEQGRHDAEEARDKLAHDREIARARADAKDHFLATLSHELRTPLTPIMATMSNQQLMSLAPDPLRAALQTVRRNLDLEVRLIDDLLDVTRISRDRLLLARERVDLHVVLQDIVEMLNHQIRQRGIAVSTALEAPHHWVIGDPTRLRQVFWNLLGNALKFSNMGGHVTITSSEHSSRFVEVSIRDTGAGMDDSAVRAINEQGPEDRAAPIQSSTGLGLGLAICRGVVSAHGGSLRAVSRGKGEGSTFVVQIPFAADLEQRDQAAVPGRRARKRARPHRILLVEDHEDSADTLSQLLNYHDYDVTVARSVAEAISVADQGLFDLLISDIRLPDGSGLDLIRRLQSNRPIRGIAISGFGTEQDQRRSREAGYETHLTKPVDFDRLLEAIETLPPRPVG
jgi:PAS domain S-box-containing protein